MFPLELPKMTAEEKRKDRIRKQDLVFEQGERIKDALGEDEMLKLVAGDKTKLKVNGFVFKMKNGMILGKSSRDEGTTSFHCFKPKCKERPLALKPSCEEHDGKEKKEDIQLEAESSGEEFESEGAAPSKKRPKVDLGSVKDVKGHSDDVADLDGDLEDLFS